MVDWLGNNNFLLDSGNGGAGSIYKRGGIFAGYAVGPQKDSGDFPESLWFSRDLDFLQIRLYAESSN
jgi:hypothetical protein